MSGYDEARAERDYRMNPPDSAPRQGHMAACSAEKNAYSDNSTMGND